MRFTRLHFILLAALLPGCPPSFGQTSSDPGSREVTLDVEDQPVDLVLTLLFKSTRYTLTTAAKELAENSRVTLNVERVPLRRAVEMVVRTVHVENKAL